MPAHRFHAALCAATITLAGLAGLTGCRTMPTPGPAVGSNPTSTATPGGGSSTGAAPPQTATRVTLPVYYLGTERVWRESDGTAIDRIKLYREFHRLDAGDGGSRARARAAIADMLASSALDPDYRTGWPSGARVRDVSVAAGVVTVDIRGATRNNVGSEAADQAVQQLVWTATAASGQDGVRLLIDGQPVDELWGHVAVGGVLRRSPAEDVQAHVWLIDPQHGANVGKTFTVHVSGYVSEATINIRARQGDRIVRQTFVTVAGDGHFGEARTQLTLPAGRYTLEAYAPSNATAGRPLFLDDHAITVR
jgi:hypothetical protein